MATFFESILERLEGQQTIALPEATDARMLKAAERVTREGWAKIHFVGDEAAIAEAARLADADIDGIAITNPAASPDLDAYCREFWKLRGKGKPYDDAKARKFMLDPLFFGAMMTRMGAVGGMDAGAVNTTANVLRAGIYIVKCAEGVETVSSCFVMEHPNREFGHNGLFVFADSGVLPEPTEAQLVDIAIASARSARVLLGCEPRVAFLSFSTKGSASHAMVDKMRNACEATKARVPELLCDGEMQFDAAILPDVARRKAPDSPVAGRANVMVFPDLDAGNLGYKIAERLGGANAYGPLIQGLAKPVNDHSRGCSVDDIVTNIAITALEAQEG